MPVLEAKKLKKEYKPGEHLGVESLHFYICLEDWIPLQMETSPYPTTHWQIAAIAPSLRVARTKILEAVYYE